MNSRWPLRYVVPLLILAAGLLIVATGWFFEYRQLQSNVLRLAEIQLRSTANFAAAGIEAALRDRNTAEVRAAIERSASSPVVAAVYVVAPDGTIRYASDARAVGQAFGDWDRTQDLRDILPEADRPGEILIRLVGSSRLTGRFPLHMRMSAGELIPNRVGSLFVVTDLSHELARGRSNLASRMLGWAAIVSMIALAFWALLRSLLLRRIDALIGAVREVAKGNFEQPLHIRGRDELAELGREMEAMTHRLREHSERLAFLSDHDALTGLLNRHGFEVELKRALRAIRRRGGRYAVALLDVDSLRVINDTQGHLAGDELLGIVADRVGDALPEIVCAARVGGDEFAVLFELAGDETLESIAARLQDEMTTVRFDSGGERFGVQVSMGLVELSAELQSASDALGIADAACYRAKDKGRGSYYIGSVDRFASEQVRGDMQWVSRIQAALDQDRLQLYAQPIVPLGAGEKEGLHFEILVRMLDERGRILPPGEFLEAAERYNLVHRIDRWVVKHTLDWLEADAGLADIVSSCAINLSGLSLGDEELIAQVSNWLDRGHSIPASALCFEVTETAAVQNLAQARVFINRLRAMGCRFALDDFGTGLSSFGYLKRLPVDLVKIDGIFVRDMARDSADLAMVSAINDIAHELDMKTVAEFVEDTETLKLLREIGVDFAQGYVHGRPLPLEELVSTHARRNSAVSPLRGS
ncbi:MULTISPECIES: bifunctional diguanylate cyclase/phosphodiesterase [unclassified Wenzhouxiangella]|uniref:putative bifunctional diguanylate cyclase/phosphodiesterase n=1 Tax=unclassified Wenzhouxiangella TaxID=2613841 RepID=UPI000E32912C|nr:MULTISPECIES: EAL domain-containing protein [unclassified Wenzhouxiangella]RFF27386.1 EAL domain-containing protein [Wenzhouxiangella sp. 15181]RFP68814.1 EAL domain-containing protein [Wenzhouxiangella sp. 15190]